MRRSWIDGHWVMITGAAGGLGLAMALEFARRGARLVLTDVDPEGLAAAAEQVQQAGAEILTFEHDVREPEAWARIADQLERDGQLPRILINNAGVAALGLFVDLPLASWKAVIDIDLWGVIHGCREFVPRMLRLRAVDAPGQPACAVMNVSSAAAYLGGPLSAPYFIAKAGVFRLTQSLQCEIDPRLVSFSNLCPGPVETGIGEASARLGGQSEMNAVVRWLAPRNRKPEDVATRAVAGVLRRRTVVNVYPEAWLLSLATRLLPHRVLAWASRLHYVLRFPRIAAGPSRPSGRGEAGPA
jgi:NAD(P)-dependent dehydrogenase (short-subunit alcohol dehydrogenase family)